MENNMKNVLKNVLGILFIIGALIEFFLHNTVLAGALLTSGGVLIGASNLDKVLSGKPSSKSVVALKYVIGIILLLLGLAEYVFGQHSNAIALISQALAILGFADTSNQASKVSSSK